MEQSDELSQDEALIQSIKQTVLRNLENEQFGVESLSEQMGISRSHLHRKIKLLKGKSISQYISQVRLEEAMKLLQKDVANISEIAYRVGFTSNSYFNKCFREYYGYPPGDVKRLNLDKTDDPYTKNPIVKQKPKNKGQFDSAILVNQLNGKNHRSKSLKNILIPLSIGLLIIIISLSFFVKNIFTQPTIERPRSIAVLPLDPLTDDPEQEIVASGMHDAIIGELGKIDGLRVISRTSTLKYQNQEIQMQEVAHELGVDVIIEGSVYITGDSLRLQLQCIEAFPKEKHLWAQEYYQDVRKVLAMQNSILKDIANEIKVTLTPEEKANLAQSRTVDPETYKAYLRGMYYLDKGGESNRQKGMEYMHLAIDNDPGDPLAYAGLAKGYITLAHNHPASREVLNRAKAAAARALKLDDELVDVHAALGGIYLYLDRNWEAAERKFKLVNQLNPSNAYNHYHYAWYLALKGKKEEAIGEQELAVERDPLRPKYTAWMAWLYAYYGKYQKADKALKKALTLDSTHSNTIRAKAFIYTQKEEYDKAIKTFDRLVDLYPEYKYLLGCAYANAGKFKEARNILDEMKEMSLNSWTAMGMAAIHACLGEKDKAFQLLNKDFDGVLIIFPWIRISNNFKALHTDPRFNELLAEMDLPPVPTTSIAKN